MASASIRRLLAASDPPAAEGCHHRSTRPCRWMFCGPCQFALKFSHEFPDGFAERTPAVIKNGMPVSQRVLVHGAPPPPPDTGDG